MTDDARQLLSDVGALRRRARADRRAYGVPLLIFGLLTLGAAPLYVQAVPTSELVALRDTPAVTGLGGDFLAHSTALGAYWLIGLICGYLGSLAWYRWNARRVGVATPVRPYVVAGVVGTLAGLALPFVLEYFLFHTWTSIMEATDWAVGPLSGVHGRGMIPHLVIAAGFVVLARVERSRGLAIVTAGYAAAVLLINVYFHTADLQPADLSRYTFMLAATLPALILVIGGAVALARGAAWRTRTPAA
jgi:hypothetical protein